MGATISEEDGRLKVLRIKGLLKKSEVDSVQTMVVRHGAPEEAIKLLVIVQDFEGWERGADWGDLAFFSTYGNRVGKIAIVADPRWETDLLTFALAGLRKASVRFFPESGLAEARTWLTSV